MKDDRHAPVTQTASFRFYQELNDFLPPELRKHTFSRRFSRNTAVKDTIEAIGVPHTEIDLILVDGESVGFDHKLKGGEHVAVYPVFESIDITPLVHLRSAPLRNTRFVVDVNLGKLALKLRLLGFDTAYRNNLADHEIVRLSVREHRIILTRDKGILKYRAVTHGYWVRNDDPQKQLAEVIGRFQLEDCMKPFTRCSNCNQLLKPIDKHQFKDVIPHDAWLFFNEFWQCEGCRNIYWKGSHYERICKWIEELKVIR